MIPARTAAIFPPPTKHDELGKTIPPSLSGACIALETAAPGRKSRIDPFPYFRHSAATMNWEERYPPRRPARDTGWPFWAKLLIISLALAPFVAGVILQARHRSPATVSLDDLKSQVEEIALFGEWVTKDRGTSTTQTTEEKFEQTQRLLARGSALSGDVGAAFKVAADYFADIKRLGIQMKTTMGRFGSANPFDFSNVKSTLEIQRRRIVALDLVKLNKQIVSLFDATPERLHQGFQNAGLVGVIADLSRALSFEDQRKTWALDRQEIVAEGKIFQSIIDLCDLMEGDWGHWRGQNGAIAFERPASTVRFNLIGEEVRSAKKEHDDAEKEEALLKNK